MILEVPQLDLLSVFKRPSQRRDGLPGAASLPSISWTYSKVWGKMRSRSFSSISYKVEVPSFRSTPPRFFSLVSWSSYFAAKWTCRTLVWKYGTPKFVIICPIQTAWFWILPPFLDKPWQTHIFSGYLQYFVYASINILDHTSHTRWAPYFGTAMRDGESNVFREAMENKCHPGMHVLKNLTHTSTCSPTLQVSPIRPVKSQYAQKYIIWYSHSPVDISWHSKTQDAQKKNSRKKIRETRMAHIIRFPSGWFQWEKRIHIRYRSLHFINLHKNISKSKGPNLQIDPQRSERHIHHPTQCEGRKATTFRRGDSVV